MADQQVTFTITYADGSTDTKTAVTDSQGRAVVNITSQVAGTATVSVIAGTASKNTPVHFVFADINAEYSVLTITPPSIPANGSATAILSLQARDVDGNPVTGKAAQLSFPGTGVKVTVSAVTESPVGSGNYTAKISGTKMGSVILGVRLNGSTMEGLSADLTLTADSSTASLTNSGGGLSTVTDSVKAVVTDAGATLSSSTAIPHGLWRTGQQRPLC